MKKFIPALMLCLTSIAALAESVYTTESVDFTFKTSENARSKMIVVPKDTELTLLDRNNRTGFSKVRTVAGVEGFIVSRSLAAKADAQPQPDELKTKITALPEENIALKIDAKVSKEPIQKTLPVNQSECNRIKQELEELKADSTQTLQLQQQRDQLQERNTLIEQELNQIKRENQTKQQTFNKDWFFYGGGLAFIGVLLGMLLPKITARRKYGGWE
ncbi:MAG: TIGR04211 family SH3 domain-containing protein [Methylococcaceae bacterium]|nr:TIGR04211 family SH3 domain-containing protein [Methylococcaceae bacterium]